MLRIVASLFGLLSIATVVGVAGLIYVFQHFSEGLPDYTQLADYKPPVMTRVYAGDGRLLAEYAVEKRVFVPIEAIPETVIDAFLSAEDQHFYSHGGIDVLGIVRAAVTNIKNLGTDRRLVGASTITQQVAKNFLLSNEVSLDRKIKEAILAYRMEQAFSKQRILELYLNEIYLGHGSYGVVAAALNYFNKSLDELSVAEAAFLAALPKGPNNYDPVRNPDAALARRNWVIGRMLEDGHITAEQAAEARAAPLTLRRRAASDVVRADYFAEEIRRELVERFGESALYRGGMAVRSTVDSRLQTIADRVLRKGLETYDRRHGWRGPIASIVSAEAEGNGVPADWRDRLSLVPPVPGLDDWRLAVVLALDREAADIGFADDGRGRIPLAELKWARPWLKGQEVGAAVRTPSDVLALGDVVAVEPVKTNAKGEAYPDSTFGLRQFPKIEGALVALDPHTGRVLAMSGGYSAERSEFNRATQARRQPGSAFKPFVYLAALEAGYTPTTLILDAPFVIEQGPGLPQWRPSNYTKKFYGLSTMRLGIEKSRNLMTVRLAQTIGMDRVVDVAKRFGVVDAMPPLLSYALGSGETTLLRLTAAYAMLVNGGKRITPTLIDRIQDRYGRTTFRHDTRDCTECRADHWTGQVAPEIPDTREEVTDPASAYQVVSMLQGVVQRGTGVRIRAVGKPLAGKTGTTNESRDTWFVGFSPDLAVGVFVGFDEPTPLGKHETGSSVAVPVFRDFMSEALESKPAVPFRIPPDIRLVRIDAATGRLARPGDDHVILEAFKPGTVPTGDEETPTGVSATITGPATGTGGLY
jgi:penicillin-binding protein 1A